MVEKDFTGFCSRLSVRHSCCQFTTRLLIFSYSIKLFLIAYYINHLSKKKKEIKQFPECHVNLNVSFNTDY